MQSGGGWGTAFRQLAAGVLITLSTAAWAQTPHVKIGLVLSSLYFIARSKLFPVVGVISAAIGVGLAISGYLI